MAADKAQFGMIGMAVMGRNLALNVLDHGFRVAAFNRQSGLLQEAVEASAGKLVACNSLEALVGGARAAAHDHDDDQGGQAG